MSKVFDLLRDVEGSNSRQLNAAGEADERPIGGGDRMLRREVLSAISEPEPGLVRALDILRQHWQLSALFAAALILIVTTVTLLSRPMYEPVAALQIDPPGTEIFSMQSGVNDANSVEYITTETKKLRSNILGLELVRTLHLERMPEFAGRRAILGTNPSPDEIVAAENASLATLQERTSIKRDMSRIVYVSVGAGDPKLASKLTNALANSFIEGEDRSRHESVQRSSQWLGKQLDDIRIRMEESNKTVADFEKHSGIASLGDNQSGNTFSEQMIELNRQLLQARSDRIQLQAYLSRMGDHGPVTLPQVSSNPVVQVLTQKLAETRAELTNVLTVYGPNHPNVRRLQNQADELASQLEAQKSAILKDMRTSYQASQFREGMVQDQVKDAEKKLVLLAQYMTIKKEADANTQLYNSLSAKIREAAITAESKSSPIWIVDPAPVLDKPTRPHKLKQFSLGILVGICGGIVLAFLIEGFNTTIRTTAEVRRSLGMIPVSIMPVVGASARTGRIPGALLSTRHTSRGMPPLFLLESPQSPEAEALRAFYTSVRLRVNDAARVMLVTSPDQGEGKTMMAVNLAIALAERGKTCVVDADLRREGVASTFGISTTRGLSDVLANTLPLRDSLVPSKVSNLTVLPAGKSCDDVGRLVCSDTMAEVILLLRSEFEYVLLDSPPILPFADCRVLSTLVDGVVLVVRSGRTRGESLVRAMELLQEVRSAPVIQVVLNAVESSSREYYGRYEGESGRAR